MLAFPMVQHTIQVMWLLFRLRIRMALTCCDAVWRVQLHGSGCSRSRPTLSGYLLCAYKLAASMDGGSLISELPRPNWLTSDWIHYAGALLKHVFTLRSCLASLSLLPRTTLGSVVSRTQNEAAAKSRWTWLR